MLLYLLFVIDVILLLCMFYCVVSVIRFSSLSLVVIVDIVMPCFMLLLLVVFLVVAMLSLWLWL